MDVILAAHPSNKFFVVVLAATSSHNNDAGTKNILGRQTLRMSKRLA